MEMREAIRRAVEGEHLSELEAAQAMEEIMEGRATPAQIAAFLAALRMKGETVEEITGFARTMRAKAQAVASRHEVFVDTCGTGGDGQQTFNISTTAAFVVAGAGVPVAKHGNRSVSSRCGSADVLEELGVRVTLSPAEAGRCLDEVGLSFLFAPGFHGAMRHAAGPRQEIGIRTIFNLLGPLTNPAGAPCQVLGVYDGSRVEVLARVLGRLGSRTVYVVHGMDGLDEVSLSGPTLVSRLKDGRVETYTITPEDAGLARQPLAAVRGGGARENARLTLAVLDGEPGPCRDIVLLNAALGIMAGEGAASLREAMERAAESIDSGAARRKLSELVAFTGKAGVA